ncbi:MAG: ABC transporter ATP-binding protein [Candidatus Riflebacteria bacterium]
MQETAIKVNQLNKSFGRKKVLNDLSFNVPMNSISGFLGPNGSGKTTTLRILMGLVPLLQGEITMLGESLPGGRSKAVEQIGAVVENPTFIETMTAIENLYWFGSLYKPVANERILEAIALVGLKDAANQRFGTFSSGMKQRLGVAFGILHKPRLLILDEPTSGMDPAGRVQMREILQRIHSEEKTTIFLSSHLLDEVQRLCDYVVIIDRGRTAREGYVGEILSGHQETWEIRMPDEFFSKAIEVLKTFEGLQWSEGPRGLMLTMKSEMSPRINQALVAAEIKVSALIPHEASLEETFIKLTSEEKGN